MAPVALLLILSLSAPLRAAAQRINVWTSFENISKTPTSSTYPAAAADRFGRVHVVWSDDLGGKTRNLRYSQDGTPILDYRGKHVNYLTEAGNTLFYSNWDGEKWTSPVDIHSYPSSNLTFSDIAVDSKGMLHLVWTMATAERVDLMYSQVPGDSGRSVQAWSTPVLLATGLFAYYIPIGITADPADGLHILYYKIGGNPGVFSISSFDGGKIWSDPVQLYANNSSDGREDGSQPLRISADDQGRLHAAWTVYAQDGNGKDVYYAQSVDQGMTWGTPFRVASKQQGWYEVDWLSIGVVGERIHAVWEGGPLAFTNERISPDGGQSWGTARRILPLLVGENGWSDLVTDSQGILHQLLVKRIGAAGGSQIYALWHSQYVDDHWSIPVIVGLADQDVYNSASTLTRGEVNNLLAGTIMEDGLRYQRSVILNGNELFVVIVNEYDGEIYAARTILNAPRTAPDPLPTELPAAIAQPTSATLPALEPTATLSFDRNIDDSTMNPGTLVIASIAPVLLLVLGLFIYRKFIQYRKY